MKVFLLYFADMINFLTKPYPIDLNLRKAILSGLLFGLFVGGFLVVFRPFGLYSVDRQYDIYLWGFGLVTALAVFFNQAVLPLFFPRFFREEKWNVGKEIGITLFNIWMIAGLNLLYAGWLNPGNLTWSAYLQFLWMTLAVGLIPVGFGVAYRQRRLEKHYQQEARSIDPHPSDEHSLGKVVIQGENQGEQLEIEPEDLLFAQAEGNYLTIYFLVLDKPSKVVFRMTLRQLEDALKGAENILTVHRSWLANLQRVTRVSGNSQGLLLHFSDVSIEVPVARRRAKEVKSWFVARPRPITT
ncbi:MAG: LytTR family transcriptional regulator [Bacteroidota bacterium]|nr:LytTR family transcriptional regulator [Bacteroidota bacterium]MDX5447879.1 LytTR family transcriptional regulator [Bacteroidota bacterium]MDX5505289.1 LytTR family transcriptional regulator [Bacteroidota bacterium]